MKKDLDLIHYQGNHSSVNFLWKIRFCIARLLLGKKSVIGNCKLINVEAIVNNDSFIYDNYFIYGKNIPNRTKGITLKPQKKSK